MSTENGNSSTESSIDTVDLLDPTYPLLAKFRDLAAGTYKHCQALASMVEGVSLSLGLNVKTMKIAATYHDVGKIYNPAMFTENQKDNEDPHKDLDPRISYQIITRHVSDSVIILLNDPNFSRDIIDIISTHHGQTVLKYFFNKSESNVDDFYRYKTPKPATIEAAVLMMCDVVEAMSRSKVQAGKFDPDEVIETTVNGLIADSQLDEVFMKLGDLKKIKLALAKELEGTYQKRVDYDTIVKEVEDEVKLPITISG
jgi:putative nucleotidyltransferase with HDIG domain